MHAAEQATQHIDRFKKDGKIWIWTRDGAQLYDIPHQNFDVWRKAPCPCTGRKLHPPRYRQVKVPARRRVRWMRRKRRYLDEGELQEITAAKSRNSKPAVELPKDAPSDATPVSQIQKHFPKATLRRLRYAHEHPELTPD